MRKWLAIFSPHRQIARMTTHATHENDGKWRATTILAVRKNGKLALIGDGQVSLGNTVMKGNARKVRQLIPGKVLSGFAGATADAFTLFERLEQKLERYPDQLQRAAVELAKDWRTEKYLQKLEAMLIVADSNVTLLISGQGDVIEPEHHVLGIGSGGHYAVAAARGLYEYEVDAEVIARRAMEIASDICVFTNSSFTLEVLDSGS